MGKGRADGPAQPTRAAPALIRLIRIDADSPEPSAGGTWRQSRWSPELDGNFPESSTDTDSETALLLANIESALRGLEKADRADDRQEILDSLELALHIYGSVKHLLPKLDLSPARRAPVEEQLQALRAQILAHNTA